MADDPQFVSIYCQAVKRNGERCVAFKAAGRSTCAAHDPETIATRRRPIQRDTIARAIAERARLQARIADAAPALARLQDRLAAVEARLAAYGMDVDDDATS